MQRLIEYKGENKTLKDWSKTLGINYHTLYGRLRKNDFNMYEAADENYYMSNRHKMSANDKDKLRNDTEELCDLLKKIGIKKLYIVFNNKKEVSIKQRKEL